MASMEENTQMVIEAILEKRFEDADNLLDGDVDFYAETRGENVVQVATRSGNINLIKKLKIKQKRTASSAGNVVHLNTKRVIEALLEHRYEDANRWLDGDVDFNVETRGDYIIHVATIAGRLNIIEKLMSKKANIEKRNEYGNTPMHFAAWEGQLDIVKYLKENGAELNVVNTNGESPLHLAVITQPMDVIETLVDIGMNPNIQSKETGRTPLHTALLFGRTEAMEGLLIKGAEPTIRDNNKQTPEDVGKTMQIRESLRMYGAFLSAKESGLIKAKGMKLTTDRVKEPQHIDRVNIRLEYIDIPQQVPSSFYCRREQFENSTVKLPKNDEEQIFSDVFHVRISDVDRACRVKINLPVDSTPSNKEEIMLRFMDHNDTDRVVSCISKVNEVNYCLLETKLIPNTMCVCALYVRPKKEENIVTDAGMLIKSEVAENFSMDIPAGAFEGETTLSLMVYDSNADDRTTGVTTGANKKATTGSLVSDIFQINVSGQQPKKGVTMQIPLSKSMKYITKGDDIAIITGDEKQLEDTLEVSKSKPKIVNGMIVFNVSHFCIYVATPRDKVASTSDLRALERQISDVRDRKKPGVFFVMVKQLNEGLKHLMMMECCSAVRSAQRRERLVSKDYEQQTPDESEAIMMAQGDNFTITISGNASLEEETDMNRKLTFSPNRVSSQPFTVLLAEGIMDKKDATADIIIHKHLGDGGSKEVARIKMQLHPPPPSPPTPASNSAGRMKVPGRFAPSPYSNLNDFFGSGQKQ